VTVPPADTSCKGDTRRVRAHVARKCEAGLPAA
jgi:hypothetical protein